MALHWHGHNSNEPLNLLGGLRLATPRHATARGVPTCPHGAYYGVGRTVGPSWHIQIRGTGRFLYYLALRSPAGVARQAGGCRLCVTPDKRFTFTIWAKELRRLQLRPN